MKVGVEVVGMKEVQDALAHVPETIRELTKVHIFAAGSGIKQDYQAGVPFDEGDLYRSIYEETSSNGLTTEAGSRGVPYARHVEFGTEDTPAVPALFPAFLKHVRILRRNLRGMLKESGFRLKSRVTRANVTR